MDMHELFPDWMRLLTPDGDVSGLQLGAWWAAIEDFSEDAEPEDVVQLVRCAHGRDTGNWEEKWRQAFRDHDETFPLRGQQRQVSVLAGAAVVHLREGDTPNRPLAHYGSICAGYVGWEAELPDVVVAHEDHVQLATEARELPSWRLARVTVTPASFADGLPPADGNPVTGMAVRKAIEALASGVGDALGRAQSATARVAQAREAPLVEEFDVLRWLLSGYCRSAETPWADLSPVGAAIAAAAELDGLTRFWIGRPDATALLAQTVALAEKDSNVQMELPPCDGLTDLAPLTDVVRLGQEPTDVSPTDLAVRLYDEIRFLTNFDKATE